MIKLIKLKLSEHFKNEQKVYISQIKYHKFTYRKRFRKRNR